MWGNLSTKWYNVVKSGKDYLYLKLKPQNL
jgi:hypothetical protein